MKFCTYIFKSIVKDIGYFKKKKTILTKKYKNIVHVDIYKVCKLSNETGNVAFDAATLEVLGLEEQQRNM